MRKNVRYTALILSGILTLGGCSAKDEETIPQVDFPVVNTEKSDAAETIQEQPENGEASETVAAEPKAAEEEETVLYGSAPVVSITRDSREWYTDDDEALLLTAEESIVTLQNEGHDALRTTLSELWSGIQAEDYEEWIDSAQEFYNIIDKEYSPNYYFLEDAELTRSDSSVISFRGYYAQYTGGVHGNYGYVGTTIDVESGRELVLEDLLSNAEEFYDKAVSYITEELAENYGDGLFSEYEKYVAETFSGHRTVSWYLNAAGIVIIYNPYEVGPYAMGTVEVTLPYSQFGEFIQEAYISPHSELIAQISANEDISQLIGESSVIVDVSGNEYELNEVTVLSGMTSDELGTFSSFEAGYVIRREDGRCFLVLTADYMSDDYVTAVYEVTGGIVKKCDELQGAKIGSSYIGTDKLNITMYLNVLGTYGGQMEYILSDDGMLIPTQDIFTIDSVYEMTVMKELPVTVDGTDTTLEIGTRITVTATNNIDTVYFKVAGSDKTGEIKYTKKEDEWQLYIDGVSEYEYFDMIPYAG